ncbi:PREDICTED: SURP and G-patch domain-containing protein 1-like [Acropora digitifera]|uniref:SURP and G-patch domain-containing protein 1-like n=1 Tax=Acropora digitifera TaxID=70779 RepID=UPI00077AA7A0|nr:PREDICTED: SURP and G-patch domain-containing protein 1-like [Acropora digitifera]
MASSTDRQKLVEDKKHELLRRIAEKKKNEQTKQSNENFSTQGSSQTASKGGAMFLNDGNFLARFQAMQQQNTQSAASLCSNTAGASGVTSDPRPAVSLKLTTVKKTTPAKTVATRPDIFEAPEDVEENVPPPEDKDTLDNIEVLAARVVRGGDKVEHAAIQENANNPEYKFLFDLNSQEHKYYRNLVTCLRRGAAEGDKEAKKETNSSISSSCGGERKRKRKSRWESAPPASASTGNDAAIAAALAVAAEIEHSVPMSNREEEEKQRQIKEQQEIQQMYMRILAQRAACQGGRRAEVTEDKPKYEYDSDEDIEGGTWEHKKRKAEMRETEEKAQDLTTKGKGKHHIGDFLPPEEMKKFTAKVKVVKGESSLDNFDFSDYAEHKIKEDNIGYKMLQQAGWQEGKGLGSKGQGITAPVDR